MRILYIIPAFQHPTVRGPHRHYHFVRELSRRHSITLVTLKRSDISPAALEEVASQVERLRLFDATEGKGFGRKLKQALGVRAAVKRMRRSLRQLAEFGQFDVVLFHGKPVWSVAAACGALPLAVNFCDATSMRIRATIQHAQPWRRPWLYYRYRQMRRIEQAVVRRTPHLAFISARDRSAVLGEDSEALVLPNGVDLDFWTPRRRAPEPGSLIFTGVMDYGPNDDAALRLVQDILPKVRAQVPGARLTIAGRSPTERLKAAAAAQQGVNVTGFVDDMRDYLERAELFVCPLRYGAGMQNKVLEALAMEVPVVATSLAAEGLRFDGHEPPLCVADDPQQMADRVADLLANPAERARLSRAGRQYIEDHFSWAQSAEKLEQLCLAAVESARSERKTLLVRLILLSQPPAVAYESTP